MIRRKERTRVREEGVKRKAGKENEMHQTRTLTRMAGRISRIGNC
jgi:hypothetical protein